MKRIALYGSLSMTVDEVARSLEASLSIKFAPHDSLYLGEYYRMTAENEELLVQANAEDDEGYLPEPAFAPRRLSSM